MAEASGWPALPPYQARWSYSRPITLFILAGGLVGVVVGAGLVILALRPLRNTVAVMRHIVRTALIPVVTLIALQLPVVFSGAIVTEQIFRVPGIGSLLVAAMLSNDTPVVMAITFVFSCLVVLFNLLADVLYGWLDPRISYR